MKTFLIAMLAMIFSVNTFAIRGIGASALRHSANNAESQQSIDLNPLMPFEFIYLGSDPNKLEVVSDNIHEDHFIESLKANLKDVNFQDAYHSTLGDSFLEKQKVMLRLNEQSFAVLKLNFRGQSHIILMREDSYHSLVEGTKKLSSNKIPNYTAGQEFFLQMGENESSIIKLQIEMLEGFPQSFPLARGLFDLRRNQLMNGHFDLKFIPNYEAGIVFGSSRGRYFMAPQTNIFYPITLKELRTNYTKFRSYSVLPEVELVAVNFNNFPDRPNFAAIFKNKDIARRGESPVLPAILGRYGLSTIASLNNSSYKLFGGRDSVSVPYKIKQKAFRCGDQLKSLLNVFKPVASKDKSQLEAVSEHLTKNNYTPLFQKTSAESDIRSAINGGITY